jgi:ABC-type sugar transport system permease subunit
VTSVLGRAAKRIDRLDDRRFALLAVLPGALFVGLLVLPPILGGLGLSLFRVELARDPETPFVALRNFERLLSDETFLATIPRTIVFAIGTTVITIPLALGTALALNRGFRGVGILGIVLLMPWAVAPVVTGLFWNFIFNGNFGLATGVAMLLGLTERPIPWLQDTGTAVLIAVVATAWRSVPLAAILLLAALKTIPKSLYRAGQMDGATTWRLFRHITLPAIRNTLLIVAILQVILSLQVFDLLYLLTGGGPGRETTVMNYYIYQRTVQNLSFGYASALAIVLFLVILAFSSVLLWLRLRNPPDQAAGEDESQANRLRPRLAALALEGRRPEASPAGSGVSVAGRLAASAPGVALGRTSAWLGPWLRRALLAIGVVALAVWLVGPILWIAIASVQPEGAVTIAPPQLTTDLRFDRYASLIADPNWIGSLAVSLQVTLLATAIVLVLGALAAYPLARLEVPGKRAFLGVLIFTQMVPAIVLAIPVLMLFQWLGLKDTIAALVLVNVAFWMPLIVWLLRNVFEDVPRSLEWAARMDGCTRLGTLFRVTIPAARPGMAAAAILVLIGTWNEFLFAVVLGDRNAVTMTRRISQLQVIGSAGGVPPFTLVAAAGLLVALPCLLLVLIFHRRIVSGLTEGYVKG